MASAVVGSLRVLLEANADKLESQFEKATSTVAQFDKFTSTAGQRFQQALGPDASSAVTKLHGEIGRLTSQTSAFRSTVSQLGPALVAGFSIAAVGKLAGDFVEMSGHLVDLEAKTGITVTGLQRLKLATQESGVSLEQVADASLALSKRLGEGKESTIGTLDQLGIKFSELRGLKPEDQFFRVADAVGKVGDQNQKVAALNDLMGKTGANVLPALNGKLKETADAYQRMGLVMRDDVIRSGDQLGDQWTVLKSLGGGLIATVIGPLIPGLTTLTGGLISAGQASAPVAKFLLTLVGLPFEKTIGSVHALGDAIDLLRLKADAPIEIKAPEVKVKKFEGPAKLTPDEMKGIENQLTESAKASIKLNEAAAKSVDDRKRALREYYNFLGEREIDAAAQTLERIDKETAAWRDYYNELGLRRMEDDAAALESDRKQIASRLEVMGLIQPGFEQSKTTFTPIIPGSVIEDLRVTGATRMGPALLSGLQSTISTQFGPTILAAITGGGNKTEAIGSLVGQSISTSLAKHLSSSIVGALGSTIGGALNTFLPGVGALLGPLLGKIFGGPSKEVLAAREKLADFRKELEATATKTEKNEAAMSGWGDKGALTLIRVRNALQAIGRSGGEADAIVKDLLNTDNPAKMAAAMRQVTDIMDQAKDKAADAAAQIERQKQAFEDAKQGAHDFVDQLSSIVENSGLLPSGLDGYIQRLKAAGLLTDDDAAKLAGLKDVADRVTFDKANAAVEMFGGHVENLGPAFNQLRIDRTATQYIDAIEAMVRASGDVGGALTIAKDKLGALAAEAIRSKATLPAQLEPFIRNLAETHQLLDENGHEITDLRDLKFGAPVKTEADKAKDGFEAVFSKLDAIFVKIGDIIDKVTGPLQQAIDGIDTQKTIDVKVNYDDPGFTPRGGEGTYHPTAVEPIYAAEGGTITDSGLRPFRESAFANFEPVNWRARGTDTIPAMLSKNEVVVPHEVVSRVEQAASALSGQPIDWPSLPVMPMPVRSSYTLPGQVIARTSQSQDPARNVTVLLAPIILDTPTDVNAIADQLDRRVKETFAQDLALDRFGLSATLVPILEDRLRLKR